MNDIASMTLQHLLLSLQGVVWAVLTGIPLGWAAHRHEGFRVFIFTISEWLQIFHEVWRRYRDFFYVKNVSLWLDILVSLRTLRVVFSGHGAK